jgi:hypothetical protein
MSRPADSLASSRSKNRRRTRETKNREPNAEASEKMKRGAPSLVFGHAATCGRVFWNAVLVFNLKGARIRDSQWPVIQSTENSLHVFWDVRLCNRVHTCRRFGGTCSICFQVKNYSYPCSRPWSPMGLRVAKNPKFSR